MAAIGPAPRVRNETIEPDRAGQRLDNFLLGALKGAPRSLVYRLLRSGQVRVNGRRARPGQRLEAGDVVRIPPVRLDPEPEARAAGSARLQLIESCIVHEDERLLALDKPSGLASHGGSGIDFGAIELLRQSRPEESLELVHRLDRDTSGLLVVARKRSALLALQTAMRGGRVAKRYLALLTGRLAGDRFTVDVPLSRAREVGGERMVRVEHEGKPSVSHFRLIERRGGHSYTEVGIDTGRTHQIRVHAAHIGHPVAGDDKYGDREINRRLRESTGLRRMFLHAASLEFELGQTSYLLSAPLPADLSEVLDALG
ncbi:MAG TPA: RluA family pseudouridine synthase [Xanthomonadaceae bacterium]|nr:RluA family pseudouridine synthase [Xanthomonadaceae bacterium]